MKCHGCNSSMLLDRQETAGRVTTEWYQCPVCHKMHMHSELAQSRHSSSEWVDSRDTHTGKNTAANTRRQSTEYA